jgi:hypothetical protein
VVLGAPASLAAAAPADGIDRCVAANTTAQALRRDGKFGAARAELASCVDASCPALVRDDCNQRLDELERAQPTIVFDAKDHQGHDVSDVTVEVDGRPLIQRLDGIAIAVDPGEHTFTFEAKSHPPKITRKLVLREGEKARREPILLGTAPPTNAVAISTAGASRAETTSLGAQRVVALAALGIGVVGIGTGVAFTVQAQSKATDADDLCPGARCTNEAALRMNHDARVAGNVATVAFAVGAVGVAGAVVLWLTAKPSPKTPSAEVALVGSTVQLRGTW